MFKKVTWNDLQVGSHDKVSQAVIDAAWAARPTAIEVEVSRKSLPTAWSTEWVETTRLPGEDTSPIRSYFATKTEYEFAARFPELVEVADTFKRPPDRLTFISNVILCGPEAALAAIGRPAEAR